MGPRPDSEGAGAWSQRSFDFICTGDPVPEFLDARPDWLSDGQALLDAVLPEDRPRLIESLTRALETSEHLELAFRLAPGPPRPYGEFLLRAEADGPDVLRGTIEHPSCARPLRLAGAYLPILEGIAVRRTRDEALEAICQHVEELIPDSMCSIVLLDPERYVVEHVVGPSLPTAFARAFVGIPIGPEAGSCGTALHYGSQVITPDIETDPKWAQFREAARPHGLRACWSTPYFGADGRTAGSFAVYAKKPRHPNSEHLAHLATAAHLAGIVHQRHFATAALKAAESQLEQAHTMATLGQLAGTLVHDFNNALSAIMTSVETIQSELAPDSPVREDANIIEKAARDAALLTQNLLGYARRPQWTPEVVSVSRLLGELGPLLQRTLGPGCTLVLETPDAELFCETDRSHFERMLINLTCNARDAMPEGGTLRLRLSEGAPRSGRGNLQLEVVDDGAGMDAATLARVFDPFFTTKPKGKGTGLGLAEARQVVERSAGTLDLSSEPGRGTRFLLELPIVSAALARSPSRCGTRPRAQAGERVLVLEGDEAVRAGTSRALRNLGYEVWEAGGPQEALAMVASARPGKILIVVDDDLPAPEVRALEQRLAELGSKASLLHTTAAAEETADLAGPTLAKPFRTDTLAQAVRRALDA